MKLGCALGLVILSMAFTAVSADSSPMKFSALDLTHSPVGRVVLEPFGEPAEDGFIARYRLLGTRSADLANDDALGPGGHILNTSEEVGVFHVTMPNEGRLSLTAKSEAEGLRVSGTYSDPELGEDFETVVPDAEMIVLGTPTTNAEEGRVVVLKFSDPE